METIVAPFQEGYDFAIDSYLPLQYFPRADTILTRIFIILVPF